MRYAFLAMVVIYLITFFGCSPDEQKENHRKLRHIQHNNLRKKLRSSSRHLL